MVIFKISLVAIKIYLQPYALPWVNASEPREVPVCQTGKVPAPKSTSAISAFTKLITAGRNSLPAAIESATCRKNSAWASRRSCLTEKRRLLYIIRPRASAEDLTQAFDRFCSDSAQPGGGQIQARTILTNGHGQSVCSPSMLAAQPIADSFRAEL